MLHDLLHIITLSYSALKVVDCCLAQSRSNYFRIHLMFVAMCQDRLINAVSLSTVCEPDVFDGKHCFELSLQILGALGDAFLGTLRDTIRQLFYFQTDHSIVYRFLLQTCFRSTFIFLIPSSLRILYLDRMPEFLPQGYSTRY
jgi:hypothetical protein